MEKTEIMDAILMMPFKFKMCYRCGAHQSHPLVYCRNCGDIFRGENLTELDALRIAQNRDLKNFRIVLTPRFMAYHHKEELKNAGLTEQEFIDHINSRM
jgi:hypothetical protein